MRLVCPLVIFSTLLYLLPHNVIIEKKKLLDLIERAFKKTFKKEGALYISDKRAFYTST